MKLRAIVADDNSRVLHEIVSLLRKEFDVVATASDGGSARECIQRHTPDVAVLDLVMPNINGIELTRELTRNGSSTKVIICSIEEDRETVEEAFRAGAMGYVFKPRIARDLIAAVKSVAEGHCFTSAA